MESEMIFGLASGGAYWFADKVFGKALEPLGQSLGAYLSVRCNAIFGRSTAIAEERYVDPQPIAPGLLARLVMDASFSTDDEDITEWWANLFVDASIAGDNHHAVFGDMMALLGPKEVQCLDTFVQSFPSCAGPQFGKNDPWIIKLQSHFEGAVGSWIGETDVAERNSEIVNNFLRGDPSWPCRPTEWRLPLKFQDREAALFYGHDPNYTHNRLPFDILGRAGILAPLDASFSAWGGTLWVRGIGLTLIGYEFYRACKGRRPQSS
jgi:hypothetical protein